MSSELSREQTYVTMLYARLDALRARANERLSSAVQGFGPGGTQQARSERDSAVTMYADHIAQYNAVENGLCFGRLDLIDDTIASRPVYIGRIGIHAHDTDDATPLLMDWRAPAARPFYLATVASPEGVRRRRHIQTRRREVIGVEDEVLDLDGGGPAGSRRRLRDTGLHDALTNENALLAAMNAEPYRADERHRRDDPGRTGPDHPLRPRRHPRRAGRSRHRQDRGRAAPGRVPALHPPRRTRPPGRADRRTRTRRSCATSAGCCPGSARARSCSPRSARCSRASRRPRPSTPAAAEIKGRDAMADVLAPRHRATGSRCRTSRGRCRSTGTCSASTGRCASRSATGCAGPGSRTTRRTRSSSSDMVDALARQVADRIGTDVLGGPNLLTAADIATIRDETPRRLRRSWPRSTNCGRSSPPNRSSATS